MVGAFAVGKTSLVRRFVESIFSEKYHTTIGVKIDKKQVQVDQEMVQLMIWDIEGVDVFTELNTTYLRGASGMLLVIDGTRENTVDAAQKILDTVTNSMPETPVVLVVNKCDLKSQWALTNGQLSRLNIAEENIFYTSAKTGECVEEAFSRLAELTLGSAIME